MSRLERSSTDLPGAHAPTLVATTVDDEDRTTVVYAGPSLEAAYLYLDQCTGGVVRSQEVEVWVSGGVVGLWARDRVAPSEWSTWTYHGNRAPSGKVRP